MVNKRKKYSKEYKLNAVKMITEQGRVAAEVARELVISAMMLYSWKRKYFRREGTSLGAFDLSEAFFSLNFFKFPPAKILKNIED